MVLRKSAGSTSSSSILGLKVVGGELLEDGSRCALIEKVKKCSTADVEGQLRPGKRITKFELNSENLQNARVCTKYQRIPRISYGNSAPVKLVEKLWK